MLYPIGRSIIEIYRGDVARGFVIEGWLSTSQFISIFVFLFGAAWYVQLWQRANRLGLGPPVPGTPATAEASTQESARDARGG